MRKRVAPTMTARRRRSQTSPRPGGTSHAADAASSSQWCLGHEVDDHDSAVTLFTLPRIPRRHGRRNRKIQEGLRCIAPLSLFPLPDLLNDERRQHRSLPSARDRAHASSLCSQSTMPAIQMPRSLKVLVVEPRRRLHLNSTHGGGKPSTEPCLFESRFVMPSPAVKAHIFHSWDAHLSGLHVGRPYADSPGTIGAG